MDIRIRGISGALMRRFATKAGSRERERLIVERLIECYVDGQIDPLADGSPVAAAMGAKGGAATAASRTPKERSEAGRRAVAARWAQRSSRSTTGP